MEMHVCRGWLEEKRNSLTFVIIIIFKRNIASDVMGRN